jgi:hypothetical protein
MIALINKSAASATLAAGPWRLIIFSRREARRMGKPSYSVLFGLGQVLDGQTPFLRREFLACVQGRQPRSQSLREALTLQ